MATPPSRWTKIVQPAERADPVFRSLTDPITRASTIVFDNVEQYRKRDWRDKSRYSYGLQATPITRRLEQQLCLLDGAKHALLYPSGLNAICMTLMALLRNSDHLLIPANAYKPTLDMARFMVDRIGITYTTYDPLTPEAIPFTKNTRMVWVETPGSITMEISDLRAIAEIAHRHQAVVAVDATWSAGISLPVFELGADISIHALTKYPSGGSDVMMGAITTSDDDFHARLYQERTLFGIGVSPEDCYLLLRSLPHLRARYEIQDSAARLIAGWLQHQPYIYRVLHPAFSDCPGHAVWKRDFCGAASLFSVVMHPDIPQDIIDLCIESLQYFRLGVSWGGPSSLVLPFMREQLPYNCDINGGLIRFYIGLESPEDLITDIERAFTPLLDYFA